jgi:hypothetical protein
MVQDALNHFVDGSFLVIHKQGNPAMGIVGTGMHGTAMTSPDSVTKGAYP